MGHEVAEYGLFTYDSNGYQDITIKVGNLTASASPGDWVELKMTSQEAKFNDSYMNNTSLQAVPGGHQDEGWALYRVYGVHPSDGTAVYVYLSDPEQSTGQLRVETYNSGLTEMISDSGILSFERKLAPTQYMGYYPLFTTEADANSFSPSGTSHYHQLNSQSYYMPDGLSLGYDQFHGDLYSAGFYEFEGSDPDSLVLHNPNYVTEAGRAGLRFTPGADSSAIINHPTSWDDKFGSFTISFWIKTTQASSAVLFSKLLNPPNGKPSYINVSINNVEPGRVSLDMQSDGPSTEYPSDSPELVQLTSDPSHIVNDGEWHNIIVILARGHSPTVTLYIDGMQSAYYSITSSFSMEADNPFYLGLYPGPQNEFDGIMDSFRLYNDAINDPYAYYNTGWISDPANIPSIDQTSADNVGDTLTVSFPGDTPSLDTFYFERWIESGQFWEQIPGTSGANVSSYSVVMADSQKNIRAVAYIAGRYYYSEQVTVADFRNPSYVPSIVMPDPVALGDTLTVSYDNSANISSFKFQRWNDSISGWDTIWSTSGAAVVDYSLTGEDSQKDLRVAMTIDGLEYTSLNASIPDLRDPNMNPTISPGPFSLGGALRVIHQFVDPIDQFSLERSFDGQYWTQQEWSAGDVTTRIIDYTDNLSTYRAKFVVNSMEYYSDSVSIGDLSVNIVPMYKFGYGPIFLTEGEAILYPGSNGTATPYSLSGSTYYMPNGLPASEEFVGTYQLSAQYDFDSDATALAGIGVDGSFINGTPQFIQDAGRSVVSFVGSESIIFSNDSGIFDFLDSNGNSDNFAVSFWAKYNGSGAGSSTIFSCMKHGKGFSIGSDAAGRAKFTLTDGGYNASNNPILTYARGDSFDDGNWHHLIFCLNRDSGTAHIFIDGSERSLTHSDFSGLGDISGANALNIGIGATDWYIDDVKIYQKIIDSEEADYIYDSSIVLDPNNVVTLTVRMLDTYGDGWNGGNFVIRDYETNFALDGGVFEGPTNEDGTNWADVSYTVPANQTYKWTTNSGSYPSEGRVIVLDQSGTQLLNLNSLSTSSGEFSVGAPPAPDTTAPAVTLNGDATVLVFNGGSYTELGATALDNNDGDITGSIVITNSPDVNVDGTYNVTYKAVDAAGNEGFAYRTVHVKTFTQIPNDDTSLPLPSNFSGWTNADTGGVVAITTITEYTITPFDSGPFNVYLVSGNASSVGPKVIQEKVYDNLPAHTYLRFSFDLYTMHGSRDVEVYLDDNLIYTLNAADMIQVDDISGGAISVPFPHSLQYKGVAEFTTPHTGSSATIRFEIVNEAFTRYAFTPMVIELDSAAVQPQLTYGITGGAGDDEVKLMVFLNGKLVHPSSYTVVGEQITFNEGTLSVGDEIYCVRAG